MAVGLWVEHERAIAGFYQLKDRLNFYVAGRSDSKLEIKEINSFYSEYEQVWSALNQEWIQQRHLFDGNSKSQLDTTE